MWNLDVEWPELVLRGVLVYLALLCMLRVSGKRTVGQFTPFDLLVIMLLSEAASNSMTGGDDSLPGGLLVCAVLMALNAAAGFLSARSRTVEAVLEGEAVLVARDGQVFRDALRRHRVSRSDWGKSTARGRLRRAGDTAGFPGGGWQHRHPEDTGRAG